jgi:MFS transporter, Spinster family, sphingosine-1-phosphate transporter
MKARFYRQYLLIVLTAILTFNYADRLTLGILMQDIKADLSLSDTQLGVLTGIAFALFYSTMGIPIARWADRGNRVAIISITTVLWSGTLALYGWAASFTQLLFIRIVAAVGEAGCMPPAQSLIADHFPRAERPRAIARYMLGVPLSGVVAYLIAGWLNELHGWRVTFMLLGIPGMLLAVSCWTTLREPRRQGRAAVAFAPAEPNAPPPSSVPPDFKEVCATLWSSATFRNLLLCWAVVSFFSSGIAQWKPAFFMRSFNIQTGELGTWFALIYGLGGLAGVYWGGELAARRAAHNERLQLMASAAVCGVCGVISMLIYLSVNRYVAFGLVALTALGGALINGPMFATIQTLLPSRMRATALAIVFLFGNLIGLGLGPLAAGMLSDAFRPWAGEESLRYALLALCPGYLWAGWHLWRASRTVAGDVEAVELQRQELAT